MSVNRHKEHVLVLPEDDANRQIANGFTLHPTVKAGNIDIRPNAGGWAAVRDAFEHTYNAYLTKYPKGFVVLLVDFDDRGLTRREAVLALVEDAVKDRIFLLGTRSEPERLKKTLGKFEAIGKALAKDCNDGTRATWQHDLLLHNQPELDRMLPIIKPILFG